MWVNQNSGNHKIKLIDKIYVMYQFDVPYKDLLKLSNSFSLQQKRVQFLLIKLHKNKVNVNPDFYVPFFKRKKVPYNNKRDPLFSN